jgi:hypothetical protein
MKKFSEAIEKQGNIDSTAFEKKMASFFAFTSPQISSAQLLGSNPNGGGPQQLSFNEYLSQIRQCDNLSDAQRTSDTITAEMKRKKAEIGKHRKLILKRFFNSCIWHQRDLNWMNVSTGLV